MTNGTPHLLILLTGHTSPEVIAHDGDYDRWFIDSLRPAGCRFTVRDVPDDGLGDTGAFDGVLVTGTTASVLDRRPWMDPLADFLADAAGPPTLAVCFAAQLAADALGGRVERNPAGWEIGTVEIEITAAGRDDPLLAGLSDPVRVQATHEDVVTRVPPAATLLARNRVTPVQAFTSGRLHALQFHPEAHAGIVGRLIDLRREALERDALAHGAPDGAAARQAVDDLSRAVCATPAGETMLTNWVNRCVRRGDQSAADTV
ncbi:MAG: type 1 glutamine amidotransferase [Acidobacteriota bacterium]